MASVIPKETRTYIDGQIDYYISEAKSYRQIAETYLPEISSVSDTAFGIISGCIYSSFLQACQSSQRSPSLEEIQELVGIIKDRAPLIKRAILQESEGRS